MLVVVFVVFVNLLKYKICDDESGTKTNDFTHVLYISTSLTDFLSSLRAEILNVHESLIQIRFI